MHVTRRPETSPSTSANPAVAGSFYAACQTCQQDPSNSERVNASDYAYKRLQVPDAVLMQQGYTAPSGLMDTSEPEYWWYRKPNPPD